MAKIYAPGSTMVTAGTQVFNTSDMIYHNILYTVADVDTNVIVSLQGTLDDTNYVELVANTTITTDGTYRMNVTGGFNSIKFTWVSLSGGSPTIIPKYVGVK